MESEKVKKRLSELQLAFSRQMAENKARMDAETAEHNRVFQQMIAGVAASLDAGAETVAVEGEGGEGMSGNREGGKGEGGKGENEMQEKSVMGENNKMPDGVDEGEQTVDTDAEKHVVPKGRRVKMTLIQHMEVCREKEKAMLVQQINDGQKANDLEDEHGAVGRSTPKKGGASGAGGSGKGVKGVGGVCKKEVVKEDKNGGEVNDASEEEADGPKVLTVVLKFNDPDAETGDWFCSYCPKSFPPSTRQKALISTHMERHHSMVLEDGEASKRERKKRAEAERKCRRLLEEALRRRGEGKSADSV